MSEHGASINNGATIGEPGREARGPAKGWKKPNTTSGWKIITDTMAKYDKKILGGWKDELGNLLIFVRPMLLLRVHIAGEVYYQLKGSR